MILRQLHLQTWYGLEDQVLVHQLEKLVLQLLADIEVNLLR